MASPLAECYDSELLVHFAASLRTTELLGNGKKKKKTVPFYLVAFLILNFLIFFFFVFFLLPKFVSIRSELVSQLVGDTCIPHAFVCS